MGLQLGGTPGLVVVVNGTTSENLGSGVNLSLCCVAWRPDGSYALLTGQCGTVLKFTDMQRGLETVESHTHVDLTSVSWKPDGSFALITGSDGVMLRFDHDTQLCLQIETNTFGPLGDISWDTSGEHAQIKTDDGTTITYPPPAIPCIPEVTILEPEMGSTIAGVCLVRGIAFAESGFISDVQWRLDSGGWEPVSGTDSWQTALDTASLPNGLHSISVTAWSSNGEHAIAYTWISVANALLPPLIEIASPDDGAALSGMVVVSGTAASLYGPLERVDVRLDDNDWEPAVGIECWKRTLDTTTFPNGVHRIMARAWDGNSFSAASHTVTIGNVQKSLSQTQTVTSQTHTGKATEITTDPDQTTGDAASTLRGTPQTPAASESPSSAPLSRTADGGAISVPMASWGILLLAALALATEHGKFALFQFLFVPLYSRIKKDRVLDNFTRGMIYGFIMSNPGVHYNFIKQKLGLNNGSIVYHLTVLERQELIKSEKVGLYKRFYPRNGNLSESGIMELSEAQENLLELVRSNPGLTQREIAERMGLSGRVINYHVGLLQRSRLLTLEKVGKTTRCYATERMPVC